MVNLPKSHRYAYEELQTQLGSLRDCLNLVPANLDSLRQRGQEIQYYFQSEILSLSLSELDSLQVPLVRSLYTEIHRSFRLLQTDLLFLKTAQTPVLQSQKRQAVGDRLQTLQGYCQMLLNAD